jgi:WD40 repeat protein
MEQTAQAQERIELLGHEETADVLDLAFSPTGELIASGASDGMVLVWDANSGALIKALEHVGTIEQVQFSPDGRHLATNQGRVPVNKRAIDGYACVQLWDTSSWKKSEMRIPFERDKKVQFTYLHDGDILTCSQGWPKGRCTIQRWSSYGEHPKVVYESDSHHISSLAVSPDGKWLVGASNPALIWDTDDLGRAIALKDAAIAPFAFSPDSQLLAGSAADGKENRSPGRVNVWRLKDRRKIGSLSGFVGRIHAASFSRDGKYLAAAAIMPGGWGEVYGERIQVWDLAAGAQRIVEQNTHAGCVAFSPVADVLATSFATPRSGIRLWDSRTGQVMSVIDHGEPRKNVITHLRYSPRGDRIAAAAVYSEPYQRLCIWVLEGRAPSDGH